jgi:hypothetical protein
VWDLSSSEHTGRTFVADNFNEIRVWRLDGEKSGLTLQRSPLWGSTFATLREMHSTAIGNAFGEAGSASEAELDNARRRRREP